MKIKYIALCLLLVFVGCQRDEEMEITQLTISSERIEPSYSSVSISCNIISNVTIKEAKVYVSKTTDFSSATTQVLENRRNAFTAEVSGLADGATYYIRYQISNRWVSLMAEEISEFQTIPATEPTVTTTQPKEITHNSAIMGGKIVDNGGLTVTNCGVVYGKSPNPTIENSTKVENKDKAEAFTCLLTNLEVVTTYYARAYAINEKGVAYGEEVSFKTGSTTAAFDTLSISDVTATSAVISGALLNNGGEFITALGVCCGVNHSPTLEDATVINAELDDLKFSVRLNDLQKGTTYYVRAYVTNSHGTVYSEELCFNTEMTIPAVTTTPATDISYTSATVGGKVTEDGGASVTERGVVYSTNQSPTTEDSKVVIGSGLEEFTCSLTNLQDGMTYYARAYAVNSIGTAYGDEVCFTTKTKTIATVATTPATNVSYTSAIVGGNVTDDGGLSVTERGICYSTSANPTTANTKVTSGTGTGSFTCNLTDLQDGTTYYVRAYAVNEKGTAYGEEVRFTTKTKTIATVATTPATNVSYTSATVGGNVTNDGGASVTERGICYSTSANPTTADTKVTSGTSTGSFTCNLTDLQDNTTYYARAYAVNAKGTAYGEEVSFTTIKIGDPLTFTVNGVSFTMIAVEGGTFTMGATAEQEGDADSDEYPTHKVTLSDYMIGETEVTQELWQAVMGTNPSYFKGTNLPVEYVSWDDCQAFISELNAMTGKKFRLPTEAEWEYAARGGNKSNGFKYSGSGSIDKVAWYDGNSSSKTHPVKQKQANELGIYDMSGNVWEWCQDWYGSYSSSAQSNPTGPSSGASRVCRGGNWSYSAGYCRVSYRSITPTYSGYYLGLRLAL